MRIRAIAALIACLLSITSLAQAQPSDPESSPDTAETALPTVARIAPVELKIPVLGVEADVLPVGADADGAMAAPSDPDTVVWWSLGHGTGEPGNLILAAHVDWGGRLRVFGRLHQLTLGDSVYVIDEKLREYAYEVQSSRLVSVDGAALDDIFGDNGPAELTLITCGGQFDPATRQYLGRLIVRARQV